jgi:hypothetical protein
MGEAFYIDLNICLHNYSNEIRDRNLSGEMARKLYKVYVGQWFLKETHFDINANSQLDYLIGGLLGFGSDQMIVEMSLLLRGGNDLQKSRFVLLLDENIAELEKNLEDLNQLAISMHVIEKHKEKVGNYK